MKACEFCDKQFKPKVTYQVYCGKECRDQATRAKIVVRYETIKRQKRKKKIRMCLGNCGTKLSIYNDDKFCNNCNVNKKSVDKTLKEIKGYFDYEQQK